MKKRGNLRYTMICFTFLLVFFLGLTPQVTKAETVAALPKVSIVSLDHFPFVEGDQNAFYVAAKNYVGQVQYQLFYTCKTTMGDKWELIESPGMENGWTQPTAAQEPITVDITHLNLSADYYRFAIRVRRVGVEGAFKNPYGDYDDAYPFAINVEKKANINLNDEMVLDKTSYTQDDTLLIRGVGSATLGTEYKLHLYDVQKDRWLTNLTEYGERIEYPLSKIPAGKYVVDVWCKNYNSTNKYDGWKLKIIEIKEGTNPSTGETPTKDKLTLKEISQNSKAVVYIEAKDKNKKVFATGSGFITDKTGRVVTNFHVLKDAYYASVTLEDGSTYEVEGVLGYNEEKDIAVVQLKDAKELPNVTLGDSDALELTDEIVAIGSPEGYKNTISTGIVSGLDRESDTREGKDIQITAALAHGSSGGALFNMYGEVVGITYAGYNSGSLGFAIPMKEVLPYLKEKTMKTLPEVNNLEVIAKEEEFLEDVNLLKTIDGVSVILNKVEQDGTALKVYVTYINESHESIMTTEGLAKMVYNGTQYTYDVDFNFEQYNGKQVPHVSYMLAPGESGKSVIFFKPIEGATQVDIKLSVNLKEYAFNNVKIYEGKEISNPKEPANKLTYEACAEVLRKKYNSFTLNGYTVSVDEFYVTEQEGDLYVMMSINGKENYNKYLYTLLPEEDTEMNDYLQNEKQWETWASKVWQTVKSYYPNQTVVTSLYGSFSTDMFPGTDFYYTEYDAYTEQWDVVDWIFLLYETEDGKYGIEWSPRED